MSGKDALMASLMGGFDDSGGGGGVPHATTTNNNNTGEQDLFGDIPPVGGGGGTSTTGGTEILPSSAGVVVNDPSSSSAPPPPPSMQQQQQQQHASLLMQSGLLGGGGGPPPAPGGSGGGSGALFGNGGGDVGGGLFDAVDEEEERKAAAAEAARRKKAEEDAAAAAAEAEAKRQREEEEQQRQRQQHEEAHRQRQQQQQQQQRQQWEQQQQQQMMNQMQDQMQSIHLGAPPPMMSQQQQQQQQPPPAQQQHSNNNSFYREQQQPPIMGGGNTGAVPSVVMAGGGGGGVVSPAQQQPQLQQQQHQARYYQPQAQGNMYAGMHNGSPRSAGAGSNNTAGGPTGPSQQQQSSMPLVKPDEVVSMYSKIVVDQPLLVQSPSILGIGQPPYWSYQLSTHIAAPPQQPNNNNNVAGGGGVWLVRRRFRHVVALEDRLKDDCPGAILPPRPEKHATRAIEEASTMQSVDFAMQRAQELSIYLNQLIKHPVCCNSTVLRLFLALQDDLGTAWPEVSSNALTRLAQASVGAAVKVSETTSNTKFPWQPSGSSSGGGIGGGAVGGGLMPLGGGDGNDDYCEDNAELLALQSSESVRIGAVLQAVPKLEGATTLLREHAEQAGAVGMELGRLVKDVETTDQELSIPMELIATGLLRSGRRSKRLSAELSAAMNTFVHQYKLCKYERSAFQDRRDALIRRSKERRRADVRASQLLQQQRQMYHQPYNNPYQQQQQYNNPYQQQQQQPYLHANQLNRMERDAVVSDTVAVDATQECEIIGRRLKSEINRVSYQRRTEWCASVKVICAAMKEAASERTSIWESVRESFYQTFPEYCQNNGINDIDNMNNNIISNVDNAKTTDGGAVIDATTTTNSINNSINP